MTIIFQCLSIKLQAIPLTYIANWGKKRDMKEESYKFPLRGHVTSYLMQSDVVGGRKRVPRFSKNFNIGVFFFIYKPLILGAFKT